MRVVGDAGKGEGKALRPLGFRITLCVLGIFFFTELIRETKSYKCNGTLELYWSDRAVSTVAIAAESKRHLFEDHVSHYKKLT